MQNLEAVVYYSGSQHLDSSQIWNKPSDQLNYESFKTDDFQEESKIDKFLRLYWEEFGKPYQKKQNKTSKDKDHLNQFVEPSKYLSKLKKSESGVYFVACVDKIEGKEIVVGGIIFEYFKDSKCGLISYIFVDPKQRSNGYGRFLIIDGMKKLVEHIESEKKILRAVFFETENPLYHKDEPVELEKIIKRLRFFKEKAFAKHVDIPYVQPPIPENEPNINNSVYSLYLMVLPIFGEIDYGVILSSSLVLKFLFEYYENDLRKIPLNSKGIEYWDSRYFWCQLPERNASIQEYFSKLDLFRMELCLKISDLLEDLDPIGLLETKDALKFHKILKRLMKQ